MTALPHPDSAHAIEEAWREAVVEVEHLRQQYLAYVGSADNQEEEIARIWFQFWRAERRCNDLFKAMT